MKTSHAVLSVALCLAIFCCAYGEENVETREEPDAIGHIAKKRSPSFLDDKIRSLYPLIDEDGDVYKRSSLFRFGKRGDTSDSMDLVNDDLPTWFHGKRKRQFRYGKRQFRYGKRQFRYGKRGTLFRFGRSGNAPDGDEREAAFGMMSGDYLDPNDLVAKRSAFHWGSDA